MSSGSNNFRILQRPTGEENMTFQDRVVWLREDILNNSDHGTMQVAGSGGMSFSLSTVDKGPEVQQQHINKLRGLVRQANELFAMAKNGQGGASEQPWKNVSEEARDARLAQGLAVGPTLPKEDVVDSFWCVSQAYVALGEQLELFQRYAEALPVYHRILAVAEKANREGAIWLRNDELATYMTNLGLCYKRAKLYDRAEYWYNRAKDTEPGGNDATLQRNQQFLAEARIKDTNPVPPLAAACWTCGNNAVVQPVGLKLLACSKCKAEGKTDVGLYCDEKCQKKDWKVHKQLCHRSTTTSTQ